MKNLLTTTALVLTLTFSGMVYADQYASGKEGHGGKPSLTEILPKDKAEQFHEAMKQAHAKNLLLINHLHELCEEKRSILTAPQFDKQAYLAKSEELSKFRETLHAQMKTNKQEAFASAVGALSQEERQALAASMEQRHHEHHGHHHHHHWDHEQQDGKTQHEDHKPMHDKSAKQGGDKAAHDSE